LAHQTQISVGSHVDQIRFEHIAAEPNVRRQVASIGDTGLDLVGISMEPNGKFDYQSP
jgi:hypothetical protein